jgi:uncharacterized protein YjbI with pentapeptide repeats
MPATLSDEAPLHGLPRVRRRGVTLCLTALVATSALTVASAAAAGARTPPLKKPSAPQAVVAAPINGGADVSWSPPASDGGSPITGYTVTTSHDHGCTTSGALSCTITGLTNGKSYFANVQAANSVGLGKKARALVVAGQGPNCSDFSPGANLQYCKYNNEDLGAVDLAGANLYGASLLRTNVTGANLSGVTLTAADLNYADLADTNVANTVFDSSDPSLPDHMTSGGVIGIPAVFPPHWGLVDGYLIGPVANLTDAALAGADLSGFDLTDVNLTGADLSGANLTGVTWSNTTCPDGTNSNGDGGTCVNNLG